MSAIRAVYRANVIGSSGGIGAAMKRSLVANVADAIGLSRSQSDGEPPLHLTSETSIAEAAARLRGQAPFFFDLCLHGGCFTIPK